MKKTCFISLLFLTAVIVNGQVVAPPPEVRFPSPNLPPLQGVYVTPAQFHAAYANGIVISNIRHRRFTQSFPPPVGGASTTHSFGSIVEFDRQSPAGGPGVHVVANANCTVIVTPSAIVPASIGTQTFDTEMLTLNISGGGLPALTMIRESPTLKSTGRTTVRQAADGNGSMISSFFDIFTELSLDGGANWSPALQPAHVELQRDVTTVPAITVPSNLLPPPNDLYISPAQFHVLFANGIVIRDIRHSFFTRSLPPPPPGASQIHEFGSQVDYQISTDRGLSFRHGRSPAPVAVQLSQSSDDGSMQIYDTEMLQLDLQGGDLPPNTMLRESPTRPSTGGTAIQRNDDGTFRIGSFFDIFVELSVDGGQTWSPGQEPAHVELICEAPEVPFPDPLLPPPTGEYLSGRRYHGRYLPSATAPPILVSNIIHRRFTTSRPPPPPGQALTHQFGSEVEMMYSRDGGANWSQVVAPASTAVSVRSLVDDGPTRFFDTEMLSLSISGGGLPVGVMVRESPSKASLGRTSMRMVTDPTGQIWDYVSSFFDIFTEVSLDNGQTWLPSLVGPKHVAVTNPPVILPITLVCPPEITVVATGAAGAVVNYPAPTVGGGCPPVIVVCNPPSGSTFPIGTTTVTCTASDACRQTATCQFRVTVRPPLQISCPPDMKVGAIAATGVVVNYPPPVVSGGCPPYTVVCNPPSGSVFLIGTTPVTCTASDTCNNSVTCSFKVTVFRRFVEIDRMEYGLAAVTLQRVGGGEETVTLAGPTEVHVFFDGEMEGDADDSDGDGLEDADTEMVSLSLVGSSSMGPVRAVLRPGMRTLGRIQETANNTRGTLDVEPFVPGAPGAESFFDVFADLHVGEGANAMVLHPEKALHMRGIIRHKPPAPGDTYVNPFTQPMPLLDANGNPTGISIVREVHTPNPEKERDLFTYTQGKINLRHPDGRIERVIVAGPTDVLVCIPPNGAAADTDGDGLDQVPMEMEGLSLTGNSSLGPVMVMLDPARCRSFGVIEEKVNNTPGILDLAPFVAGAPGANSSFDLCLKIVVGGRVFRPCDNVRVHIESMITHKPPRPGEAYMNLINQEIELCDENGNRTGIILTGEMHTPNVPKEIDFFPDTVAQLTVRGPTGAEEIVTVRGPTRVVVCIDDNPASPGYGLAADTDADGRDAVPIEMDLLQLSGNSSLGPLQVSLRADRPSLGEIEEQENLIPGTLEVPPFGPGKADSYFNIWPLITVGGQTYHTPTPLHMAAVIRHKPPAPGDEYVNPFDQPVPLLDAAGNPTGFFIVREVHTPNTDCEIAIRCPLDMKVGAIVAAGVVVNYPPPVVVGTCPPFTVVCNPPSGSVFPIGVTTVTCTATDRLGKSARCEFQVTVFRRFVEIDRMEYGLAAVTLQRVGGGEETVTLAGPTEVHVFFDGEMEGDADDSDGDGLEDADTEMVSLSLVGSSSMGPVRAVLRPGMRTLGRIQETANNTRGTLDVEPFVPGAPGAESFFDVFADLHVGEGANAMVLHPEKALHMRGIIRHKPPAPGDTYVNPFTQPMPLLDANGNPTGISIVREVHTPNPEKERDLFTYTQGKINLRHPDGRIERVIVAGPTDVLVCIPPNGAAADTDGDGLDQVPMEMEGLSLTGNSSLGPVMVMLDPARCRSFGVIEEKVNNTPGILDLAPFVAGAPGANSSFDLCLKIVVGGRVFRPCDNVRVHIESMITHKPPRPGEAYMNLINQEIELCDENGNRTGIILTGEMHTPNVPKEIDFFPDTVAQLTVRGPTGAEEIVTLRGPTRVEVCIDDNPASPGYGLAADTDADGRDAVPTEMTLLQLAGNSSLGLLQVSLRADRPSTGEIEEQENQIPGTLEVPPFGPGKADSYFNIWPLITVGGQTYHTPTPLHMAAVIRHKPPAPGDEYVNPFDQPVPLLDAAGNPTGFFIVREVHTPNIECQIGITCPPDMKVGAINAAGVVVNYPPPVAVGTCPPINVVCVPPSGSVFPIGVNAVTCTATDRFGNSATCAFRVTVFRRFVEIDRMEYGLAAVTLQRVGGGEETVTLAGPTEVHVFFDGEMEGDADDSDGDGLEDADTEMVSLSLVGSSSMGQVRAVLRPGMQTVGRIQETANNTRGTLDVEPFVPGAPGAESFFDVFVDLHVGVGANAMVLHPEKALHMRGIIRHKPPAPGDTYVNPFTQPMPLLDANGNPTGISIVREVHTPNPEKERDLFTYTQGKINLRHPDGRIERVIVAGPTDVLVCIPPNGAAADTDGDGLDQVPMEMEGLSLTGNSSLGPVMVMLDPARCRSFGVIEEKVNNTPGILDLAPFVAGAPGANSSFDLCLKIVVNGRVYRPCDNVRVHIESMITHKPPRPGEAYMNLINQEIPLCDENDRPTGIVLTGEMHTPNVPKEIDFFPDTVAQLTVRGPTGAEEVVTLRGPTRVEVCIDDNPASPGYGLAADTDADGRDEVPTEMTLLQLSGNSSLGPLQVSLRADRPSTGEIEEQENLIPGTLEVPPFAPGKADSYFNIWPLITVGGQTYHTATPLHLAAVIRHKPPAPGDEYVNPFDQPVPLLDANGNPTGFFIVREVHTPDPRCPVTITCPSNIVVWGCSPNGQTVNYPPPTATSSCNLPLLMNCSPPSGSNFPPGNNTVTCTARDPLGNTATCTFTVRVIHDTTPPVITCPSNIVVWTCSNSVVVPYTVTARDDCDPNVAIVCQPPGNIFPAGVTTVVCTARDDCGNIDRCEFTVRVTRDTTPPVITCPSNIVVQTCRERERVTWTVSATDDCDPTPTVVCDPPSGTVFPIGSHVVTCRAVDDCGNGSSCQFRVEVRRNDALPRLTITRLSNNRVQICWTATCTDWVLQCTRSLNPPIMWETVTDVPTVTGGQRCVILPNNGRHQFYRLAKRDDPPEVYAEDDLMPPQGVYSAPGDEITVILYPAPGAPPRRILARWFVHPVPRPPLIPRPAPCLTCPPETFEFRTDLDFQVSLDEGDTWREVHMMSDVGVIVSVSPQPIPPSPDVNSYEMEMVRLDASTGGIGAAGVVNPGVLLRESPSKASLGKHTVRKSAAGDGTYRIGSFFDIFVEVSLDGGNSWGAVQRPVRMVLDSSPPGVAERTDTFPPAGSYDSPPVHLTRYANGLLLRRLRHPILIPPIIPRPRPCLSCPPETYEFQTDLLFEFSVNGGQTWQSAEAPSQVVAAGGPCNMPGDVTTYDTEMRRLDAQISIPGTPGVLLRESPTLKSRGMTRVGSSPSLSRPYLVGSFFDIFTEISLDGGQTWSPSVEATHVVLQPEASPASP